MLSERSTIWAELMKKTLIIVTYFIVNFFPWTPCKSYWNRKEATNWTESTLQVQVDGDLRREFSTVFNTDSIRQRNRYSSCNRPSDDPPRGSWPPQVGNRRHLPESPINESAGARRRPVFSLIFIVQTQSNRGGRKKRSALAGTYRRRGGMGKGGGVRGRGRGGKSFEKKTIESTQQSKKKPSESETNKKKLHSKDEKRLAQKKRAEKKNTTCFKIVFFFFQILVQPVNSCSLSTTLQIVFRKRPTKSNQSLRFAVKTELKH